MSTRYRDDRRVSDLEERRSTRRRFEWWYSMKVNVDEVAAVRDPRRRAWGFEKLEADLER